MEGQGRLGLVFFLSVFVLLFLSQCLNSAEEDESSLKLELIHRHAHPQLNSRLKTQLERVKELHHNDMIRQNMIVHKRRLTQTPPENRGTVRGDNAGIGMQIYSASDFGLGQYFASFNVGTPSQKFTLVVDTGSDLTWMNCRYRCGERCRENARINQRPVFRADLSSSFRPVPCLSRMCKVELSNLFSLNACPTPHTPCGFDFRYVDGSGALGFFANETVSVDLTDGRMTTLHGVLVGCSDSFKGDNFDKGADGVLGLANGKYSFTTKATQYFGGKFSYCLVDHLSPKNVTNYLVFGSSKKETSHMGRTRHTKLELNLIPPFYAVNVVGISVGKIMVNVPVMAWDATQGGGMILDSGMSLTLLSKPAYMPVMFALEASLTKYERVKLDGVPMEYCFNSTGFDKTAVPKLVFHFVDGARFEPFVKSYIIDVAVGVKCLGIVSGIWPASSVIGNIMQQNHLWEFDLVGKKLGFTRSTCS
ncbi:hypothetical protein SLEP1_g53208 [Rubroshorea leprosula]|uniref:Peptidase A1 domain-containing protein n=1 Tax=Rubroshorea leprosula TaxID=152421 RepID=A0AAV5M8R2_9ROSI|nr:hypothetical protein SLEP1_g53208 [Rubroshorea leprosula]